MQVFKSAHAFGPWWLVVGRLPAMSFTLLFLALRHTDATLTFSSFIWRRVAPISLMAWRLPT